MPDRIWLQSYAPGVPAQADTSAWPSLRHLVDGAVARYGARPAFTNMGTTLDFTAVDRLARDFAGALQHDLGLQRGERLAIMLPNLLQYPVVLFGAFLAGLTVVNVNPQYTPRELERQLLDAGARDIVVLENFAHIVEQVLPRCALRSVVVTRLGDLLAPPRSLVTNFVVKHVRHLVPAWTIPQATMFGELMQQRRGSALRPVEFGTDAIAFIQYTSGTTGAPVQPAVAARWQARTGVALVEGYGLTEAGVLTCNPLDSPRWDGTVGLPYPSTDISIRDDDDNELPVGGIGEVCARGPQVMRGYWNRPEDTAQAFTPSGWLRTGDIGTMDATGRLKLVDRKKDMIIVSGFKVYPAEIEDVVAQLPGVADCAAIGMADAASGEAVRLLVARSDPGLDADAVSAHCRARLTAYKCPKVVEFRASLPKSPIGKVLKRELREPSPAAPTTDAVA